MATTNQDDYDPRIDEAKQFLNLCNDVNSNNRAEALDDVRFAAGDQWPVDVQNSRVLESRPCLTINKVDAYIRQICNQQRQQRPRIKVHGMNNESDAKLAEILTGVCRHIEVQSNADAAYDTAFEYAVKMGWGYFRVTTDYQDEDTFEQEIYIKPIDNPFTVYFDPNSQMPDGSDAEKCLITTVMTKKNFKILYPDKDDGSGFTSRGTGDVNNEWVMKEDIRVAEYFYTVKESATLVQLSDGTTAYEDELPSKEIMAEAGISIIEKRHSYRKKIKWCKLTSMEVLEEGTWASKYIPIIPVYGQSVQVDSKNKRFGLVRMAKDPQRMYNYWSTALTESVALAPKAKWILAEGQDEGHENEWAMANIKSLPVLRYKQTDTEGRVAPPPQRMQPEPPPAGVISAMQGMNADLQAVVGIYDPSQLPQGNQSGKAIQGQQQQVDMVNFHYYDNLTRSIAYCGRIILDLIPKIYDTERVLRIIGADGKPEMVTLNQRTTTDDGVEKILNDVSVGRYDVVMDTGPGYQSKRLEAVDSMMSLLAADPNLMQQAGDLIFRNMDFPGADIIADRLAAANPMAQIDEKSPVPPQVQMQLANSQKVIQELQQQLQALTMDMKYGASVAQQKDEAANKRKLMDVTARAHNTETMAEVRVNDQNTRSITSQNKTEIDAIVKMLIANLDTRRLEAEIARRNEEQYAYAMTAQQDIDQGQNPLMQAPQPMPPQVAEPMQPEAPQQMPPQGI
ncbi:Phage P22-like portal protein [uncultured Caudovirales phage]|uniref:Phage P22-like portal protein n=1 Tax=uncultured Caudovirales phage TaxID=2100421 RepID=A0A6J5MZL3_9CAUD|nr:Phage P22-like portal protein [uncultured Caudovirales phage]